MTFNAYNLSAFRWKLSRNIDISPRFLRDHNSNPDPKQNKKKKSTFVWMPFPFQTHLYPSLLDNEGHNLRLQYYTQGIIGIQQQKISSRSVYNNNRSCDHNGAISQNNIFSYCSDKLCQHSSNSAWEYFHQDFVPWIYS